MRHVDYKFIEPIKQRLVDISIRVVVFVRPFGSKLYRVHLLPDGASRTLDKICTHYHKGVWYFRIPDEETRAIIAGHLINEEIDNIFVEPDTQGIN